MVYLLDIKAVFCLSLCLSSLEFLSNSSKSLESSSSISSSLSFSSRSNPGDFGEGDYNLLLF